MSAKQKIILRNHDTCFGDNILMTAIPRDLHALFPDEFLIDVRPAKPGYGQLWQYNPHLTQIADDDAEARFIDLSFLEAWQFMNRRLEHYVQGAYRSVSSGIGRAFTPQLFHGDLHFHDMESALPSFTEALSGRHIPYWVFSNGYREPNNAKVWDNNRFEKVVQHFRGRIAFVQVGGSEPSHVPIKGAINLIDKLSIRALMLLFARADGLLGPVTSYLHLSAALPFRGMSHHRPAVVIGGGHESPNFYTFPSHHVLHSVGTLTCCERGGCQRWRLKPDPEPAARQGDYCLKPVGSVAKCMDMISSYQVIEALDRCYRGDVLSYLEPDAYRALGEAVARSANIEITGSAMS